MIYPFHIRKNYTSDDSCALSCRTSGGTFPACTISWAFLVWSPAWWMLLRVSDCLRAAVWLQKHCDSPFLAYIWVSYIHMHCCIIKLNRSAAQFTHMNIRKLGFFFPIFPFCLIWLVLSKAFLSLIHFCSCCWSVWVIQRSRFPAD